MLWSAYYFCLYRKECKEEFSVEQKNLEKVYNPKEFEEKIYETLELRKDFTDKLFEECQY